METVAIILGLLGTSAMISFLASQFKTSDEGGSKYGAVMKVLFNSSAFIVLLTVPLAVRATAVKLGNSSLETIANISFIPVLFLFVVYVFFLVWANLTDVVNVMSGRNTEFDQEQM